MQFTPNPFNTRPEIGINQISSIAHAGTDPANGCINVLILDESSSMSGQREQTIKSVNDMLHEMASDKTNKVILSTFNGRDVKVSDLLSPDQVQVNYHPNGMTNLYDAIVETVRKVNTELGKVSFGQKRPLVIFQIMTDGHENSSKNSSMTVKNMIAECEKNEWTFTFVGADIDPFAMAHTMGINAAAVTVIDKANYGTGFNNATSAFGSIKTMRSSGFNNHAIYASASIWEDTKATSAAQNGLVDTTNGATLVKK